MDKSIQKLRNNIWLFLSCGLGILIIIFIVMFHTSVRIYHYQSTLNSQVIHHDWWVERFKGNNQATDEAFLLGINRDLWPMFTLGDGSIDGLIETHDDEWEETIPYMLRPFNLTAQEAIRIIYEANQQVHFNRYRDRFLWRIPFPIVSLNGGNWLFTTSGYSWTGVEYFVFFSMERINDELQTLLFQLIGFGIVFILIATVISFFIANFLVKPSALALQRQKEFIADASHELKTPLTIIKSNYSVLLANGEETVNSQQKWLKNMEFGFERMTNLTNDLLTLAQLDRTGELPKTKLNLTKILKVAIVSLNSRIEKKSLHLTTQIDPNMALYQNSEKFTQLLMILLDNAVKYAEVGGWVQVETKAFSNQLHIIISNSGPGIPAQKLPQIFERFFRVDESRNSKDQSYGLGLAIAKGIVDQLGGKITVRSTENVETVFTLVFKAAG